LKTTILSKRFMNSGVNFRRAAAMPVRDIWALSFSLQLVSSSEERGSRAAD
jgi:hypothetical protein